MFRGLKVLAEIKKIRGTKASKNSHHSVYTVNENKPSPTLLKYSRTLLLACSILENKEQVFLKINNKLYPLFTHFRNSPLSSKVSFPS